jgi:hypothetical protein
MAVVNIITVGTTYVKVFTERYIISTEKLSKNELFGGSNFLPVHAAIEAPTMASSNAGGAMSMVNAK